MFCGNCGKELPNDARFCGNCGTPVPQDILAEQAAATHVPAPAQPSPAPAQPSQAPQVDPSGKPLIYPDPDETAVNAQNAGSINYRVICPDCGNVQDAPYTYTCSKCGRQHTVDTVNNGFLYLYRMGHMSGAAVGQSVYLNGEPCGHVANASGKLFELKPGAYNLHVAVSTCRNCDDVIINIQPGRTVYIKSQMQMGFIKNKIHLFQVQPSEMPPLA